MSNERASCEVADRVAEVRERIAEAAQRSGRSPADVALVGASKRQPLDRIVAAVQAGIRYLGENYVQEARDKRGEIEAALCESGTPLPRWHMIGHLQRNKVRSALPLFDVVETLDRAELAVELDRRIASASASNGSAPNADTPNEQAEPPRVLDVFAQVNVSGEAQKAGVSAEQLPALLQACAPLRHLRIVGLMALPAAPVDSDPASIRVPFARLRELRDQLQTAPGGENLRELSMGMSGDFELAVEEGATLVRVGTALFGARRERT